MDPEQRIPPADPAPSTQRGLNPRASALARLRRTSLLHKMLARKGQTTVPWESRRGRATAAVDYFESGGSAVNVLRASIGDAPVVHSLSDFADSVTNRLFERGHQQYLIDVEVSPEDNSTYVYADDRAESIKDEMVRYLGELGPSQLVSTPIQNPELGAYIIRVQYGKNQQGTPRSFAPAPRTECVVLVDDFGMLPRPIVERAKPGEYPMVGGLARVVEMTDAQIEEAETGDRPITVMKLERRGVQLGCVLRVPYATRAAAFQTVTEAVKPLSGRAAIYADDALAEGFATITAVAEDGAALGEALTGLGLAVDGVAPAVLDRDLFEVLALDSAEYTTLAESTRAALADAVNRARAIADDRTRLAFVVRTANERAKDVDPVLFAGLIREATDDLEVFDTPVDLVVSDTLDDPTFGDQDHQDPDSAKLAKAHAKPGVAGDTKPADAGLDGETGPLQTEATAPRAGDQVLNTREHTQYRVKGIGGDSVELQVQRTGEARVVPRAQWDSDQAAGRLLVIDEAQTVVFALSPTSASKLVQDFAERATVIPLGNQVYAMITETTNEQHVRERLRKRHSARFPGE